jgi:adenine-specific DNA-methyltransferase
MRCSGATICAGVITFNKTTGAGSFAGGTLLLASVADYLNWFTRDIEKVKYRRLFSEKDCGEQGATKYKTLELADGNRRPSKVYDVAPVRG